MAVELAKELERGFVGELDVVDRDEEGGVARELPEEVGEAAEQARPVRIDPFHRVGEQLEQVVDLRGARGAARGKAVPRSPRDSFGVESKIAA